LVIYMLLPRGQSGSSSPPLVPTHRSSDRRTGAPASGPLDLHIPEARRPPTKHGALRRLHNSVIGSDCPSVCRNPPSPPLTKGGYSCLWLEALAESMNALPARRGPWAATSWSCAGLQARLLPLS